MKKLHKIVAFALSCGLAIGFAGCVPTTPKEVTVVDQAGREVSIVKDPERIVSGYYISSSMLIALGEKEHLVGVENMQKGMSKRPVYEKAGIDFDAIGNYGTKKAFNVEKAAEAEADLIVIPYSLKAEADNISTTCACPVIVVNPESDQLMKEAMNILAKATRNEKRAEEIEAYSANIISEYALTTTVGDAYFVSANSSVVNTMTGSAYQTQMLRNAGLNNVAAGLQGSSVEVSYEQIVSWNPDYIIIASESSVTCEMVLNDENLADIDAVKNNKVYKIPSNIEAWDSPIPAVFLGTLYILTQTSNLTETQFNSIANEFYQTYYGFSVNA